MTVDAERLDYVRLNEAIRNTVCDLEVINVCGQRFIGSGLKGRKLEIHGIAGNALGAYLDGGEIEVYSDAQDAVGDTMNEGRIIVRGNVGDALGYSMRGGRILVEGNAGYRCGIHMKSYGDKNPVIVIGGRTGSFLGEYLAGGTIIVLGLERGDKPISGYFTAAGMYGGRIFLRNPGKVLLKEGIRMRPATPEEVSSIIPYIEEYSYVFRKDSASIMEGEFCILEPEEKPKGVRYIAN